MQVKQRLDRIADEMTAADRRIGTALRLDYPFAGLLPIQELAQKTGTSAPSISRFVTKLGFQGFHEFQRSLIDELKEGDRSPVDLKRTAQPVEGAYLASFLARSAQVMQETPTAIPEAQFERICALLADPRRAVFVLGGRMSDTVLGFMSRHLRQARDKVHHLPADPESWPDDLLRMKPRDVLFVADFRRYQKSLERLTERAARERRVQVVVMTDRWLSPCSAHASEVLAVPIENGTLWDTYTGAFALIEAICTRIADTNWTTTKTRIEAWDAMRLDFGDSDP